ncbi:MAG: PD-(D/E)XK nuclease family protein [Lachnospiraceae bacterium]|nr:PD-(D/E)XK nuclease family protein [Lachnospiraceae bacterium]
MGVHFYFGSSGSGKSRFLQTEIIRRSILEPASQFIMLVPEQFTMQTQKEMVLRHPQRGLMNVDVLSFERLAYRVFDEVGLNSRRRLEEIGKSFVLEKLALDLAKKLPVLGANLARPGNLADMKSVISELMLYDVGPDMLPCGEKGGGTLLGGKLSDIATVYRSFTEYISDRYLTAEGVPDALARVCDRSGFLKGSVIAMDGYTGFTPVQIRLVQQLALVSSELHISVTTDIRENPFAKSGSPLFTMSRDTVGSLEQAFRKAGIGIDSVTYLDNGKAFGKQPDRAAAGAGAQPEGGARFAGSPALMHLERNLFRRSNVVFTGEQKDVRLFAAANPLEEIRHTALTISSMIREEGLRYRDFAVITGDLGTYGNYVRQIFGETKIPYFIDEKRILQNDPFVEYLRAAVSAVCDDYSYESIFRMLRSGMSGIEREEIDILENHVLALGIRGRKKWKDKWILHSQNEDPASLPELNGIREKILYLLEPMADSMSRRGGTVREKTEALYYFCVRSGCENRLAAMALDLSACGRQDLAREYTQVFSHVMSFLEKLVDVLGEEKISRKDYKAVLEAGFAEEKIGIIPPGADQVLVGDMERSRLSDVKVLFFVGVNEGLVPKTDNGGGLLSETDREYLRSMNIRLRPTPRESIEIGRFYTYLALTKPSMHLILSYSTANSGGDVMRPSYLIGEIHELFPNLREEVRSPEIRENIERPENGMMLLTETMGTLADQPPGDAFYELFSWYRANPDYRARTDALIKAVQARKPKDQIGRAVAAALYGKTLVNSASRLERFSACAFAHFLQYGLRLKEREEYTFSGMDMGNVLHDALRIFAERIGESGENWADIDEDRRNALANQCVGEAAQSYGGMILHDSARNEYQIGRMQRIMRTSVWAMQEQLKRGDFVPARFEVDFRDLGHLQTVRYDLPGGASMILTGRIDRMDLCPADGRMLVKIIDYKTGDRSLDMTEVYHGLQLQLVVYMNAALEAAEGEGVHAEPAGIFYYKLQDPVVSAGEDVQTKFLAEMKGSGIVSSDEEILLHLDRTLGPGVKSEVIPVSMTKNNEPAKTSRTADPEEFRTISRFVNSKIRKIGGKIMDGKADIDPYRYRTKSACDYCPYRGVCGFDGKIGGYVFREITPMKPDEAVGKMREETET